MSGKVHGHWFFMARRPAARLALQCVLVNAEYNLLLIIHVITASCIKASTFCEILYCNDCVHENRIISLK